MATLVAIIIWCSKGLFEAAAPVVGGMAGIDALIKAKGLDPIFLPKLVYFFNLILTFLDK
jgi:hypothetical protein